MRKFNDFYKKKNDIYGTNGEGGDITVDQFYAYLQSMLVAGDNITLVKNATGHTITISSSTNTEDVLNIVTSLYAPGNNVSFREVGGVIYIDSTGGSDTDDHKVIASETDTTPAELIHKVIGDGITIELVTNIDPTFGEQVKLKAIPAGIIEEAELGIQPMSLNAITDSLYFDGAAPVYKQMFFMNYNTRINTISLYCFQSGNLSSGMRFMFADSDRKVIASTALINYVPQGWVEYPLYGANESAGILTLDLIKKNKYLLCAGLKVGAQDPKWLGTNLNNITGTSGEEIANADLNYYSMHPSCINLVGLTLTAGSRSQQGGRRLWFAGYMS